MNVLILAAGKNESHQKDSYPLCLTEFDSIPLIQRVTDHCTALNPSKIIYALMEEDIQLYHLKDVISLITPNPSILRIQERTQGAACTALLASSTIDNAQELLIINANELLSIDFVSVVKHFRKKHLDAGVVIFPSVHPRYSYVRINQDGFVEEAAEKRPISKNATAGFYWFKEGKDFVAGAKNMIRKNACVNGTYYICPVFNELILDQKKIGTHLIDKKMYCPLKTSNQLYHFETSSRVIETP